MDQFWQIVKRWDGLGQGIMLLVFLLACVAIMHGFYQMVTHLVRGYPPICPRCKINVLTTNKRHSDVHPNG